MTLDEWTAQFNGTDGIACELLGCHDTMYVLCLPRVRGYLILNATTGVVSQPGYGDLALDFGADCEVKPLVFREMVRQP